MKKYIPYFLVGLIVLTLLLLLFTDKRNKKGLDERISFRTRDKIPYGSFVAYESMKSIFPRASVYTERREPGNWDSISPFGKDQVLIILTPDFNADKYEMTSLINFIKNGNDVFISAISLSDEATRALNCDVNSIEPLISYFSNMEALDTLTVNLRLPYSLRQLTYSYPGKQLDSYFSKLDAKTSVSIGTDKKNRPNFIQLKAGKGNLFVHLAPMAFTNYFLLHKQNIEYLEKTFTLLSPAAKKVVWDEYYLNKKSDRRKANSKNKGWLTTLLNIPNANNQRPILFAFWLLVLLLLIYVLLEMRRKQRYIPVVKKLRNDSLDFVKTIGRLYHDKGDHRNLCGKMAAYFLEHVRTRYKLPTNELNEEFIKNLQIKSGISEEEIRPIIGFIGYLEQQVTITAGELFVFHKQLESFYKKE